ncbi:MAG TPA: twin-arginine translocation signal domain-containing protein [Candidatus Dormibacteraeota bacterium]|jgi:hypothetical protein|nr:twin-arginine translocation signal domain-containing protein [Candidatus Dormibacteraeota bacterium]
MARLTRRGFLQTSAGAATGVAAISVPGLAMVLDHGSAAADLPASAGEPVVAYIRDASTGEVTVMAGHNEVTQHDPELVRRLLKAAK